MATIAVLGRIIHMESNHPMNKSNNLQESHDHGKYWKITEKEQTKIPASTRCHRKLD
eukprot:CAMPEP_0201898632 /NCGR_PEP_ID=MMETSP0902-20130614/48876_1 /ASSEMBLY_ACC=CAM_ASM_000551 /TAXON_ID=420261 /ORGANISM="Thalassiosira antarctica, Strain CCMP982" /LENGTH=56 /DNA_ID=CAMNT_0048431837 /DNA_START=297 /DNA_END=467 /DNA_ORIENTATION=-